MPRHGSLNHIFRLVWSQALNGWVAVAEGTRGRGKGSRRKLAALAAAVSLSALHAQAAPGGGQVIAGAGSISQSGAVTTIVQSSQNLSLNWRSFNVAPQETVNFVQPSAAAIAVNRIFDTNGSQIFGRIQANGNVYLINPNGVLFGAGAQINVGGLVASTLDLNGAALDSRTRTFSGDSQAAIVNQGTISAAQGGYIAFLGKKVVNQGTISAPGGTVALAAGNATTLTFGDNSQVSVQVDQNVLDTLAENGGMIRADGGMVVLTAGARGSLLASAVNNTGVIQARTVEHRSGEIVLLGGLAAGTATVSGTLDASAPDGGDGGLIETSGAKVSIADKARLTTAAPAGRTGTWLIDPVDFTIAASGGDISGATLGANLGNGNVLIQSTSGSAGTAGDVNVNDVVAWSANRLTLNAQRDININANLNGSGSASLALEFGQGAVAAGNTGKTVVRAAVNLPAGQNYSTLQGADGVAKNFTVITSLGGAADAVTAPATTTLQGMAATANLATNYALGGDIDAAATLGWNGNTGFRPIGGASTKYSGTFDGLGHDISGLSLRPTSAANQYIGLFGWNAASAVVRNVGLVNVGIRHAIEARTGALIGFNEGQVINSYATGSVHGNTYLGGLVGHNWTTGSITESYYAGIAEAGNRVAGLAGVNNGAISNSYATGTVTSTARQDLIGGLVGSNFGTVVNSYAASSVSNATSDMGALVGGNSGTISNSHWNSSVSALPGVGSGTATGATGLTTAQMKQAANFAPWDFGTVWLSQDGLSYPLLRAFMAPLTVTANSSSKAYNGQAYDGAGGVSYSVLPTAGGLTGTPTYGAASLNVLDVGTYTITPGGLTSTQQGYLISYASGTLAITPAPVNLSGSRAYDGGAVFSAANFGAGSLISTGIGTETLLLTGTGTVASKNVGAGAQALNLGTLALGNDTGQVSNYTLVGGTHSGQITPKLLTATVAAPGKVYDGTTAANAALSITSGMVGSETLSATGVATFNSKNVAQASVVTVNGVTLVDGDNGGIAGNYQLASGQSAAAVIGRADLTVSGLVAGNRAYDATTTATLSGTGAIARLGSDDVTLGGTAVGSFFDKNVGTGKTVTVTGNTISGVDAGNYNLVQQAGLTADIAKADLAVSGLAASNKIYDATSSATLTGTAVVAKFGGDDVALGGTAVATFFDKNVGIGKALTVTGNTLSGADAANYKLVQQAGLSADIAKADLAVIGLAASSKAYDATTTAALTGTAAVAKFGSDDVAVGGTVIGMFDDKNAGTGKAVTATGNTLSGADAGNYKLVQQAGLTANVAKADLAVSGLGASNKIYDASTSATLTGTAVVAKFGSDDVTLGGTPIGMFDDKNAGTGKAVTVTGNSLSGADAGNYNLLQQTGVTANVAKAGLVVSGLGASNKIYDATTSAMLTGAAVVAKFGNDDVTVGGAVSGKFADKNVGTGKAVAVTGNTLSGTDAGNYNLMQQSGLVANVAKADLAVSGLAASNKVYDAAATATLTGIAAVAKFGSDDVTLGGTAVGTFFDKNVGSGKAVTVIGNTLSGPDAGNYNLQQQSGLNASVTTAPLVVGGLHAVGKTYDGTAAASLSGTPAFAPLGADDVAFGSAGATFDSKNVGSGKTVTINGGKLTGADAGNYRLVAPSGLTANITAADLVLSGLAALDKVYDATNVAAVGGNASFTALIGDSVSLAGSASGIFDSKNVGSAKAVTVSGISLSGADAGNYRLVRPAGLVAAVTPATLTYAAAPAAVLVGRNPEALSGAVSGLAAAETLAQAATGALTWTTPAGVDSTIGTYPINGGGLAAENYVFVQAASNATALAVGPAEVPPAVVNLAAQLVSNMRSIAANVQAPGPANSVADGGSSPSSTAGASVNSTITFDGRGTTLKIVNGGTRLPDDRLNLNE